MFSKRRGIAPLIIILIVALGLVGGTATGYGLRENFKKILSGKTTAEEIKQKIDDEIARIEASKSKFELEGTAVSVDINSKILTVKIKSSTDSIKELRLSETPIVVSNSVKISFGDKQDLKISDIPINSKVHVDGTTISGKLTATKIVIQKEDVDESGNSEKKDFSLGGTVKEIGPNSIMVTVSTTNKLAKDQKGKDLTVKVDSATLIEKGDISIALSDIKVNDSIRIEGIVNSSDYIASKIEVKVAEQGEELRSTDNSENDIKTSPNLETPNAVNSSNSSNENNNRSNSQSNQESE